MAANRIATADPVTVSFADLEDGTVTIAQLEEAFGAASLGIILVSGLPESFASMRSTLLSYSSYLANLPPQELEQLESPASAYLTGWSLGKEALASGRFDTLKASYYVNVSPHATNPTNKPSPPAKYIYPNLPSYTAPNIWPPEAVLPGFRSVFLALCSLITSVAVLVARACDRYGDAKVPDYPAGGYLERVVTTTRTTKARLLHYFPPSSRYSDCDGSPGQDDDLCGTHLDHGCLTGLTSAFYVDETAHDPILKSTDVSPPVLPELSSSPDPEAGLYVLARDGSTVRVVIPRDCLAFQTGEALQRITGGMMRAVPHFVKGARAGAGGVGVARNTLAVFMQPNLDEVVDRKRGVDFATFAREIVEKNTWRSTDDTKE